MWHRHVVVWKIFPLLCIKNVWIPFFHLYLSLFFFFPFFRFFFFAFFHNFSLFFFVFLFVPPLTCQKCYTRYIVFLVTSAGKFYNFFLSQNYMNLNEMKIKKNIKKPKNFFSSSLRAFHFLKEGNKGAKQKRKQTKWLINR